MKDKLAAAGKIVLEYDTNTRSIQALLGHSNIHTTQIYSRHAKVAKRSGKIGSADKRK